jgi:hypothetical protein
MAKVNLHNAKKGDRITFTGGQRSVVTDIKISHNKKSGEELYQLTFLNGYRATYTAEGRSRGAFRMVDFAEVFSYDEGRDSDIAARHAPPSPARRNKPLSLSCAFNMAARAPGHRDSNHPALQFSRANNLRGIAARYRIPGGEIASIYEDEMWRKMEAVVTLQAAATNMVGQNFWSIAETMQPPAFLKKSWDKLVKLNPRLKDIRMNKNAAADMLNAHLGVTSGFNVDDINFYIEQQHTGEGKPAMQARRMPDHGGRLARIEAVAQEDLQWVASPATAKKIEQRFKRRGLL